MAADFESLAGVSQCLPSLPQSSNPLVAASVLFLLAFQPTLPTPPVAKNLIWHQNQQTGSPWGRAGSGCGGERRWRRWFDWWGGSGVALCLMLNCEVQIHQTDSKQNRMTQFQHIYCVASLVSWACFYSWHCLHAIWANCPWQPMYEAVTECFTGVVLLWM